MNRPKWKRKYHGVGCEGWNTPANRRRARWIRRFKKAHAREIQKAKDQIDAMFPHLRIYR